MSLTGAGTGRDGRMYGKRRADERRTIVNGIETGNDVGGIVVQAG